MSEQTWFIKHRDMKIYWGERWEPCRCQAKPYHDREELDKEVEHMRSLYIPVRIVRLKPPEEREAGIFKAGDRVQLKSGGPTMVVDQAPNNTGAEKYVDCAWFGDYGGNALRDRFNSKSLKHSKVTSKP